MKKILMITLATFLYSTLAFAQGIEVTPSEAILIVVGEEVTFSAIVTDSEGSEVDIPVIWSVVNDIGSINEDGEFTATTPGTGSVVATLGELTVSVAVTVAEESEPEVTVESVEIDPSSAEVNVGDTVEFEVTVLDDQGEEVEVEVTWEVTDPEVGSIDENGLFTAEGAGETQVIANADDVSGTATVTVIEGEAPPEPGVVESVEIKPSSYTLGVGSTIRFRVDALDADGEEVEEVDVAWEVSEPEVGSIVQNGLFTAEGEGETFVIATVDDISDTATVTVAEGPPAGDGNTVDIIRVTRGGQATHFGSVSEGSTITIGGLPHPLNILNGGKLTFPENSLGEDITITIRLPQFAQVEGEDVDFGKKIVTAVTFEVSVDETVISPYPFEPPLRLVLPFKRGLLKNLGIDPMDLGMYILTPSGTLEDEGITDVVVDSTANTISGNIAHFSVIAVAPKGTEGPVSVEDNAGSTPGGFSLSQNVPNPFNPSTAIQFKIPVGNSVHVALKVYDLQGRLVRTLIDGIGNGGTYNVFWDGTDEAGRQVSSGVYLYRIAAGEFIQARKMLLLR